MNAFSDSSSNSAAFGVAWSIMGTTWAWLRLRPWLRWAFFWWSALWLWWPYSASLVSLLGLFVHQHVCCVAQNEDSVNGSFLSTTDTPLWLVIPYNSIPILYCRMRCVQTTCFIWFFVPSLYGCAVSKGCRHARTFHHCHQVIQKLRWNELKESSSCA